MKSPRTSSRPCCATIPRSSKALEAGAARSQAALDRSVSARAAHGADTGGNLIDRIRAFFAMRDAAA